MDKHTDIMRCAAIMVLEDEIEKQERLAERPLYPYTAEMHRTKAAAARKKLALVRAQERP